MFAAHGLSLFDVEELPTHGGSLRIYGCHEATPASPRPSVLPNYSNANAPPATRTSNLQCYAR